MFFRFYLGIHFLAAGAEWAFPSQGPSVALLSTLTSNNGSKEAQPLELQTTTGLPKVRSDKPVFVEHVMKCGGSSLCVDLSLQRDCRATLGANCRPDRVQVRFEKLIGKKWRAADITPEEAKMGLEAFDEEACNFVFSEMGLRRETNNFGLSMDRYRDLSSSFWDAYTTVLLVRDPWERYLSHLNQWGFIASKDVADGSISDAVLSDSHKVFGAFQVKILRQNFITQHLVPDFRRNPLNCSNEILEKAKNSVDRYDIVLDFKEYPEETSSILLKEFGIRSDNTSKAHERITKIKWPAPQKSQAIKFAKINKCDYEVVKYARRRILKASQSLDVSDEE
mmetsp:Transcript_17968/g.29261  ORF Transcript_17968/g.29261 Transcript_17968/m.29261 type:complete len:337 (+) Transcript_17968:109-1119(+)